MHHTILEKINIYSHTLRVSLFLETPHDAIQPSHICMVSFLHEVKLALHFLNAPSHICWQFNVNAPLCFPDSP